MDAGAGPSGSQSKLRTTAQGKLAFTDPKKKKTTKATMKDFGGSQEEGVEPLPLFSGVLPVIRRNTVNNNGKQA